MGRPWIGVVLGLAVGACLAVGAIVYLSRKDKAPQEQAAATSKPVTYTLEEGTAVEVLLLRPLHSGKARVGDRATVVVTDDVLDSSKNVCIPAGSTAEVEVVRSREASVLSQMISQPARLEVKFLPLEVHGTFVDLYAETGDASSVLELNRSTADLDVAEAALKSLWNHPETQEFLSRLSERMNGSDSGEGFDDPDSRRIMREVADQLGMDATTRAMRKDGQTVGGLLEATNKVARGQFSNMNATETMLAIQAISELGRVAGRVDRGLRDKVKGRNIKVPIGTRLRAYVGGDVQITVRR